MTKRELHLLFLGMLVGYLERLLAEAKPGYEKMAESLEHAVSVMAFMVSQPSADWNTIALEKDIQGVITVGQNYLDYRDAQKAN